ncbi:MAG: hypothetical protein GY839_03000 [candidate division Zixibacteria bacterium]|nr:hypothetical protein [candidate division Zixibacteria bacterium]
MRKEIIFFIMLLHVALIVSAYSQSESDTLLGQAIPDYYTHSGFLMASPGVYNEGLLGFTNPANSSFLNAFDSRFHWTTEGTKAGTFDDWGLFLGAPNIGFGVLHNNYGDLKITDYRLSLGFGGDMYASGIGYSWSTSNNDNANREKSWSSGMIFRPMKCLSLGLTGQWSIESGERQGIAEIGIRPLGNPRITLFGDMAMQKKTKFSDALWSAGAVFEIVPGINLSGRYFENESFTTGLTIDFGKNAISSQLHFDNDQKHSYTSYSIRGGGYRRSVFPELVDKNRRYLKMNMKGRIGYLNYRFFDRGKIRLIEILQNIKAAADDPRIAAIALNLSSMRVAPEHGWEIREALREAKFKGKTVVIFIDRISLTGYHLASVADKIVLDPQGLIEITGYTLGKTYLKGTLAKLGLGFDEWRFFKYKSAAEILSRDSMSDADREQYQDYTDDLYETARDDIVQSRSMTTDMFDLLVDEKAIFLPRTALESDLVDTLARWSDIGKIINEMTSKKLRSIRSDELLANALPPENWGAVPEVAVVYGLGECAMDSGIRARWLERVFLGLADAGSIKAVVFRVDSPGGDALASDLVAEALKKCAAKKPVIISQGQVAGSGGYWISMYGDKILAGPTTITGSIGVIGGWIYDIEFSEKLGMTSDHVKRGKHADLGFGVRIPILNIRVPARNLDDEERAMIEVFFKEMYGEFVGKVAEGRNLTEERVREIGEGHFYSGLDGKDNGLIDEIGGLQMAIEIARKQAGIESDQEITIREIPRYKGMFKSPDLMPFAKTEVDDEPVYRYIKMLNEARGGALPMLPPGTYPSAD